MTAERSQTEQGRARPRSDFAGMERVLLVHVAVENIHQFGIADGVRGLVKTCAANNN